MTTLSQPSRIRCVTSAGRHILSALLALSGILIPLARASSSPPSIDDALAHRLGAPFRDHAVLQRGLPLPVWGWCATGTRVTVAFANQRKTAQADKNGKWHLHLDPLKATRTPSSMMITEQGGERLEIKDIVVGEVWVAAGQSNMEEPVRNTDVGKSLLKGIEKRVADGQESRPLIREAYP